MSEVFQITYNEDTERYELDGRSLTSGTALSVHVWNGLTQKFEWIDTSMEFSKSKGGYYLVGLLGYQISGLFAKM